jgi:phosphatidylserine decarboxylase
MREPHIPITREGYPFIAFAGFVTLVSAVLEYDLIALAGLVLTGLVVNFFRDPERIGPVEEDAIVAPADGKVILVEKVFDEKYLQEHAYKISIFMSVFDVHVNRLPYAGEVEKIIYSPGKFYAANSHQATLENENCAIVMSTARSLGYAVVRVAGLLARRIVCWAEKNDTLDRGARYGMIRFGSRVDIFLPQQVQIEVATGKTVKAGETILGYIS